ncbi:MAG: TonB-dependent hemoglobin/transferrin/lactoferrin family receptor [Rhizobiales bacterium]|nr:TonB-dependent hemoglobin/transferrin/lactoferrin family receptor [Hyphomicrobiales bacterium]
MSGTALMALALGVEAAAEDQGEGGKGDREVLLDTVTVSATKTPEKAVDVKAGVSTATREEIDERQAWDISEILNQMPGVYTDNNADDPATAINIRGLQDFGRVVVTIDGARQNFQRSGHNANGAFYLEPEVLKLVTVTRGPVANIYGSGAIGGVAAFETVGAFDFLRDGEDYAVYEKIGYSSNDDGFLTNTAGAARLGEYGGLLANVIYRDENEYTDGAGNEIYNSGSEILSGLVKATIFPSTYETVTVSYLVNDEDYDSGTSKTATQYSNHVLADTTVARYQRANPDEPLVNLNASIYLTGTRAEQTKYCCTGLLGVSRTFDIDTAGTDIWNTSLFATGGFNHTLTIGGDAFEDRVNVEDEFGTADLFTPGGKRAVYGAFIQDQVPLSAYFDVIGALRFDGYELNGTDKETGKPIESDGQRLSPKITLGVNPFVDTRFAGITLYGTYAEAYRAPAITETLISGFHPPPATFEFLPNPNLKPEVGHDLEGGVNMKHDSLLIEGDALRLKGGYFHNRVTDYIGGVYNPILRVYQYENIAEVVLHGFEIEGVYDAGFAFIAIGGQTMEGNDETSDEPLGTVPADKLVTTVGFRAFENSFEAGMQWLATAAQNDVPEGFEKSKSYNIFNLFSSYAVNEDVIVRFNIDNLFDTNYRPYLDLQNAEGFTAKVSLAMRLGGS